MELIGKFDEVLKKYGGNEVDPLELYRDIFPIGSFERQGHPEDKKGNGIGLLFDSATNRKPKKRILVFDDLSGLQELQKAQFGTINGLSFWGRSNKLMQASKMFAMIFDLDDLESINLDRFIYGGLNNIYPLPTYIIQSGSGVHLYYVFIEPISLYPNIKLQLQELKHALTLKIWNMYTSNKKNREQQGIAQPFRVVGGKTKEGNTVRAFKIGKKIDIDYLNNYVLKENRVNLEDIYVERKSKYTLDEAKELFPTWYQERIIEKKAPKGNWECNKGLYEWWKGKIKESASYGHRYYCIMVLAIYGKKCGIAKSQVKADAIKLVPHLNSLKNDDPFTESDIKTALECYSDEYCRYPRKAVEKYTAIVIPPNKRNGRKQEQHMQVMRAIQNVVNPNWREGNGRPSVEQTVIDYQQSHPKETKAEVIRGTGLSKKTVYKYFKK